MPHCLLVGRLLTSSKQSDPVRISCGGRTDCLLVKDENLLPLGKAPQQPRNPRINKVLFGLAGPRNIEPGRLIWLGMDGCNVARLMPFSKLFQLRYPAGAGSRNALEAGARANANFLTLPISQRKRRSFWTRIPQTRRSLQAGRGRSKREAALSNEKCAWQQISSIRPAGFCCCAMHSLVLRLHERKLGCNSDPGWVLLLRDWGATVT